MIKDYNGILETINESVILDFHASWCGPCKMTGKYLDKFNEKHPDYLILKVDVDEHQEFAEKYGVQNLPTIIYIKNGEVEWRHVGLMTDKQLEEEIGC